LPSISLEKFQEFKFLHSHITYCTQEGKTESSSELQSVRFLFVRHYNLLLQTLFFSCNLADGWRMFDQFLLETMQSSHLH